MKKLFATGASIQIEEYSSVQINGPYSLVKLGPDYASIKNMQYVINVRGNDLLVDILSEEVAVLRFSSITSLSILLADEDEIANDR